MESRILYIQTNSCYTCLIPTSTKEDNLTLDLVCGVKKNGNTRAGAIGDATTYGSSLLPDFVKQWLEVLNSVLKSLSNFLSKFSSLTTVWRGAGREGVVLLSS